MKQYKLWFDSRVIIISEYGPSRFEARLYVNHGETATLLAWKGKTKIGAERWAQREGPGKR